MTLPQAVAFGTAGDKPSRKITRTNEVSVTRSAIAAGAVGLLCSLFD